MGVYIPNVDEKKFYEICKEHNLDFIAIPAADVRPNVTGKFYLQYNGDGCWHCSECNYQARFPSNFCPNCGADMRPEPPKEE